MASPPKDIEVAALGRPFALGTLYDCRTDALIPGVTLWDHDEKNRPRPESRPQPSTEFNITASDSIEEKSNSLTVSGSLKLSILGGLVNVAGSAKYFQDTKKSHKQERLTLHYKTTTRYEELAMPAKVSHPFEDNSATHVVTAILYGASAYFLFDRESSSDDEKKQVKVDAKLMMSKLKYLTAGPDIKTEAFFTMDEKEKSAVEQFNCTFHGDFHLPSNPSTFIEAVDVYRQLPTLLGENDKDAVPFKVWLSPLVKLDSKAARLEREISNKLITYTSGVIEDLNKIKMRCNDLLKDRAATTFTVVEEKIQTFMQNCLKYKLEFVQKLGSELPLIRGGKEESALSDILKAHEKSPFNSKDLNQWLTIKGKESDTLNLFLKQLQDEHNAKVDDNLNAQLSVSAFQNVVVSFSFTSLGNQDNFLNELTNVLKPEMMRTDEKSSSVQTKTPRWNNRCNKIKKTGWNSEDTMKRMTKQLQLFGELKKLTSNSDTKFTVGSKYNEDYPGACIVIYEDGSDEPVPFIPPPKPDNPNTSEVSCNGLTVTVSDPGSATVESKVEYRMKQQIEWTSEPVQKNEKTVTLQELKPDSKYEIRVTAVSKLGFSVCSDVVTAMTLKSKIINPPTNVQATKVKTHSITLSWSSPERCEDLKQYIIEYKEENSSDWQMEETKKVMNTFTLMNLKENTTYYTKVRTDVGKGLLSPSGEELMMKTNKGPLDTHRFTLLSSGNPSVYLLNITDTSADQFSKKVFGEAPSKNPLNKTIMLVGATGSGKTTLINGMINYVLGVDWEDKWRFKLINEQTNKSQAHSQTSDVTAYQIYHTDEFQVPYSLTIIDTPGFGDTKGIKQDKEIVEKMRAFFTNKDGIDAIDAVCFVVQSALARLTDKQKYIFESILSVFGKNITSNIIPLVTFADSKSPPVLEAIKEANIPCAQTNGSPVHFKFNNSALFANNTEDDEFDYMFWRMGTASMDKFFAQLNKMKAQSLTLTKEVLEERKELGTTVDGLQPLIQRGLSTMEEITMTQAILDKNKIQIEANKDFHYEVEVEKSKKVDIPTGTFITNCHACNHTCHYPCLVITDGDKKCCDIMSDDGQCNVCPGKCALSSHSNVTYRWEIKRVRESRTYQELQSRFEAALGEKMSKEKMMIQLELESHQVQGKVIEMMETVTTCLQRLKEIALRPDPLAILDYIDLMIQSEKQEAKPGYKQRIKALKEVKKSAVILKKSEKQEAKPGYLQCIKESGGGLF
ncbi:uncharacterized protein LOC134443507 [Engraulis encrasicolus]|uniref:uncharacterized protein LOC134443507 n=1 Tax=Engraulis encrasicolus TaxID=184585 RepID=UPI002FD69D8A